MDLNKGKFAVVSKNEYKAKAEEKKEKETTVDDPKSASELDIVINNVVCSFSVQCHLNLRAIALNGYNVEYRRENGMLTMRLRRPYTTASIWSSGRITCSGATSESQAKVAARRFSRRLQKLGFAVHFQNFRIFNVLGSCSMPWPIRIANFAEQHRNNASYEPELHPGVTYKFTDPKATFKIFATGSITVTAANVNVVELAIQRIYPLVYEFRIENSKKNVQKICQETHLQRTPNYCEPNVKFHSKMKMFSAAKFLDSPPTCGISNSHAFTDPNSIPSSSNSCILSNARRRATESWVSKLQNKRVRYNDVDAMTQVKAVARSATNNNKPPLPPKVLIRQDQLTPLPWRATAPRMAKIFTPKRQPKADKENKENQDNEMK